MMYALDTNTLIFLLNKDEKVAEKRDRVGDDDIFIAAFCLYNGYTLVTRNSKDFENQNYALCEV